ncbi:universal stress protein [Streptomyces sp. NBC_01716]|uniref:universal stress protein n=1 Tax=Streptomyces sp. NBC_01716 TaxID=2975917 RepID=UPI002E365BED|nr:universal stress protein [Streptomyces sp. NBC_01716]
MEFPLVVGIDGSESSLRALDWAADEAVRHTLPLRVVYAHLWEPHDSVRSPLGAGESMDGTWAEDVVTGAARRARVGRPELKVSSTVLPDAAVPALLRESEEAYAVVIGSRGHGTLTGLLLGSVGLQLAARASGPVIVVRGAPASVRGGFNQVVLGVHDAERSSAATEFAFAEAQTRRSRLHAVHAWRTPAYVLPDVPIPPDLFTENQEHEARELLTAALRKSAHRHPSVRVVQETFNGPARDGLLGASKSADLVVIGARRRHNSPALQLGSVNHAVLHHAPCPVAIVPQRP